MNRRLLAAAIGLLLVAGAAGAVTALRRVDTVTVTDAVSRYRDTSRMIASAGAAEPTGASVAGANTSGTTGDAPGAVGAATATPAAVAPRATAPAVTAALSPAPGVYVYRTSGYEEIGIPGGRRSYPAETTMTVTTSPCGADVRWDVFEERWDLWNTCSPDARVELQAFTTYHEFFGQEERRHYTCAPGADLRPPTAGTTTGGCADGDAVVELVASIVGEEVVDVAGIPVDAVHVRLDETLSGPTAGERSSDSWYRASDGLLLRRTAVTAVDSETVFGHTSYDEELTVELTALEPLR